MSFHIKGYDQGKHPICGIYALLNGLFDYKFNAWKIDDIADELWDRAVDKNALTSKVSDNKILPANLKYSVVGEFSDSNELCDFINDKKINCILKKKSKKRVTALPDEDFTFSEPIDFENCFYLIPINPDKKNRDKYVFHWICLKQKHGVPKIVNEVKHAEKSAMESVCGKKKSISNLDELKMAFDNMKKLENASLPIECWATNEKSKRFPENAKKNLRKLKNNKSGKLIEIPYNDCSFVPIKVSYSKNK